MSDKVPYAAMSSEELHTLLDIRGPEPKLALDSDTPPPMPDDLDAYMASRYGGFTERTRNYVQWMAYRAQKAAYFHLSNEFAKL